MAAPVKKLDDLADLLGHVFKDPDLLNAAVTHSSLIKGKGKKQPGSDYDRLEFLGDRVLGLIISDELFRRFESAEAGQLSRRYNAQVRREALAEIALDMGLQNYIRMADDLAASGGRENPAILADVMEAVIAALYLDGGMRAAWRFVEKKWWPRFDRKDASKKDAKSALQEWLAKTGRPLPVYRVVEETGPDHDRHFTVMVSVKDFEPATGSGSSKRVAEQKAAAKMLKELQGD
ncbi:ribonuclease III [Sneathiella chungangensis]|uniref:Ribonuclease 3 n=1 Tax=Sneathiella chungangensis TaxID=1418234 RepID=A0A845MD15_9PROT|nr:ribonuclease III [Sneathiella chungangensis]MZR21216.1 ribonuclease III [Sneathiella chungangensis]